MATTKCKKFKGEIENYVVNGQNNFDCKVSKLFSSLNLKTCLCRTNIVKKDGYHASHLLFIFIVLPLLKIKTIGGFCEKHWEHWSKSKRQINPIFTSLPHRAMMSANFQRRCEHGHAQRSNRFTRSQPD